MYAVFKVIAIWPHFALSNRYKKIDKYRYFVSTIARCNVTYFQLSGKALS